MYLSLFWGIILRLFPVNGKLAASVSFSSILGGFRFKQFQEPLSMTFSQTSLLFKMFWIKSSLKTLLHGIILFSTSLGSGRSSRKSSRLRASLRMFMRHLPMSRKQTSFSLLIPVSLDGYGQLMWILMWSICESCHLKHYKADLVNKDSESWDHATAGKCQWS